MICPGVAVFNETWRYEFHGDRTDDIRFTDCYSASAVDSRAISMASSEAIF